MRLGALVTAIALVGVLSMTSHAQTLPRLAVRVVDPTELAVPGATVVVEREGVPPRTGTTDADGQATFDGLGAGPYRVGASLSGFSDAPVQEVRIAARPGVSRLTLRLGLPRTTDSVTVSSDTAAASSQETTVRKDSLPADVSDDPAILQSTIDALAGVGATVRVDGLTSGGLPPSSTIQQIRIRQNAFDAEFHEATPSFVEIITNSKPTPWQANFTILGRPGSLQAPNAFNPGAPAAQQTGLNAYATGNIANRAGVVFFGNYNATREDQPLFAQTPAGPVRGLVSNPSRFAFGTVRVGLDNWHHQNLRVEGDLQSQRNNDLGAGGFNLAERGYNREQNIVRLRGFWTTPFGTGATNVVRTQWQRQTETDTPASLAPAVIVLNAFSAGGAQVQGQRAVDQLEVSDVVTVPIGKRQVWRGGLLFWHGGYDSSIVNNPGGTFTFSSLADYQAGQPAIFSQRVGAGVCCFGVTQLGLWTSDDIALSKTVNLAVGFRQESESHVSNHVHLAPRGQLEWTPSRLPHTTLRVGAGIFYTWLNAPDIEQSVRVDGFHQQDLLITDPGYPDPTVGSTAVSLPSGRYVIASTATLPRVIRSSVGVDQARGALVLHADYTYQRGTHTYRGQNLNAPDASGVRPDPSAGNVVEVHSTGHARMDAWTLSATYTDAKRSRGLRVNYTYSRSYDDTDGAFFVPVNAAEPDAEWGPSSRDVHHRLGGYAYTLLFGRLTLSTYGQVNSATPYTITTGIDSNGDGIFNERPAGVGRNSARGYAYVDQGIFLSWQWPRVVAPPAQPPRYRVSPVLSVTNVWNHVNRTAVSGVLTSPYFGQATSASQPRRIYVGVTTAF